MNGKKVTDRVKQKINLLSRDKLTPEQQTVYDEHYDKIADRGGVSHDIIHLHVLRKMGLINRPK
jgi:hypothetical protein